MPCHSRHSAGNIELAPARPTGRAFSRYRRRFAFGIISSLFWLSLVGARGAARERSTLCYYDDDTMNGWLAEIYRLTWMFFWRTNFFGPVGGRSVVLFAGPFRLLDTSTRIHFLLFNRCRFLDVLGCYYYYVADELSINKKRPVCWMKYRGSVRFGGWSANLVEF